MASKLIKYPRNDQRSISAWREIGYQVRQSESPCGYCRVRHYGNEYDVWDSTQVEPMLGTKAEERREAYHLYLFRLRMYEKRYAVEKHYKSSVEEYEKYFAQQFNDARLWSLGVLFCRPEMEHISALVVTDCMNPKPPKSPKTRKATREYEPLTWDENDPFSDE